MKLNNYNPRGTEVLFQEIRDEKTAGGIYIPSADFILNSHSDMFEQEKVVYDGSKSKLGKYKVIKVGKGCADVEPGDTIIIRSGMSPETLEFDDKQYFQLMEAYIIGYERSTE